VCGGGRYDGLVTQLGGKATPGIGFAMGVDRLALLCEALGAFPPEAERGVDLVVMARREEQPAAFEVAARLRAALPGTAVRLHHGGGKFDKRIKRALATGARGCVVVDDGWVEGRVEWRPFAGEDRGEMSLDALVARMNPNSGVSL
jgi:histidyl-tRNA synthetase